ncbi:2-hydroxychromene-2-carboxylate isomerase [Sneathiella sp.]|jgi:2-hydroxychromene-2-carboxylate isomerase|uniref:2-hydroxychromene-2-carboxylate isomerase n=1 Tax=Sneathiella sp. TaxID=1964365 RepID=UPI0039E56E38
MTLTAHLYYSFRSPYSYLGTKQYRQLTEQYDLDILVKPVYPIAIRTPEFFTKIDPNWIAYLLRDCARVAQYRELPFHWPRPDPVVMDNKTRSISKEQPYIYRLTRLGVLAAELGKGMAFIEHVSDAIWGGEITDWHLPENLAPVVAKADLSLSEMDAEIQAREQDMERQISQHQKELEEAGHWGVPTLVFDGEPFFGQDRIDLAVWRMKQAGLKDL